MSICPSLSSPVLAAASAEKPGYMEELGWSRDGELTRNCTYKFSILTFSRRVVGVRHSLVQVACHCSFS